jgi:hypothetical protein
MTGAALELTADGSLISKLNGSSSLSAKSSTANLCEEEM